MCLGVKAAFSDENGRGEQNIARMVASIATVLSHLFPNRLSIDTKLFAVGPKRGNLTASNHCSIIPQL